MQYEGIVIRPPSEADSIIIQVSIGCSHNKCTFCGAYKGVPFHLKTEDQFDQDIGFAEQYCRQQKRVFLADGDALILPQKKLIRIFEKIRERLPWVRRISLYANARAVRSKTDNELQALKSLGLDRVYFGLESGDDTVLAAIRKGETARSQAEAAQRVVAAGLFLSTTVLLGIAGRNGSLAHARSTAELVNLIKPNQIAALSVIPLENTELGSQVTAGSFELLDADALTCELRQMISAISIDRVQFMANHASNYLPLSGRLQKDKKRMLEIIDYALVGRAGYVSESRRAL